MDAFTPSAPAILERLKSEAPCLEHGVLRAGAQLLEAEEDRDYSLGRLELQHAVGRWLRTLGWKPPLRPRTEHVLTIQFELVFSCSDRRLVRRSQTSTALQES